MTNRITSLLTGTPFVLILALLMIVGRIIFAAPPTTHPEANCFIVHYNSGNNPINLIFDPSKTDWDNYQARELSYLLDYLDARFIFFCILQHHAHFYSLSSLILLTASAVLIHRKLKKLYPDADKSITAALPLMYVSLYLGADGFFRSSKPAVSFLLLWLFFNVAEMLKQPEKYHSIRSQFPNLLLLFLLPGFDRIGFFIAAAASAAAALLPGLFSCNCPLASREKMDSSKKPLLIFSFIALSAVLFSLLYNFIIAPAIIEALHSYRPSFEYQNFQASVSNILCDGLIFTLKNYGSLFIPANYSGTIAAGIICSLFLFYAGAILRRDSRDLRLITPVWLGIFVFSVICTGLMIARHPAIQELPPGSYFQVFGTAFFGIFAIIFLESSHISIRRTFVIMMITVFATSFCRLAMPQPATELLLHKQTAGHTIELLNDPQMASKEYLPASSGMLIGFVRQYQ